MISQSQNSQREEDHYVLSEYLEAAAARTAVEHAIACMSDGQ